MENRGCLTFHPFLLSPGILSSVLVLVGIESLRQQPAKRGSMSEIAITFPHAELLCRNASVRIPLGSQQ
ncbi:hypothetical protein CA85_23750 [Allorhodopirellula solitaria]|uniref:Uncharacterized protein n=1 Tax=Allorhodopirellula solitaria TaxID=2527987 RepID=A0A5C5XXB7_9BACT|nr:hypothetical protein CA85_23750 [Allorhodopirellula solitaria]